MDADVDQVREQLNAANARGVGLKWYYAEQTAADAARKRFEENGLGSVVIGIMPPRPRP